MKTNKILFTFLFVFSLFIIGCSDDKTETTGNITVQITDAPFPFDIIEEANITITKIEGRLKDGDHQGSPFILLTDKEAEINLIELNNGLTATLTDTIVPVGSYDLLRIYIQDANVLLKDGTSYDMTVPSGAQSGLKVFIKNNLTVGGGNSGDILLDFDISKSFVPRGNPNSPNGITGFNFKPVIKACNLSTSGTLRGNVIGGQAGQALDPIEGATISVFVSDTLNTTTFTDIDGNYMVLGLEPGSYNISAEAEGFPSQIAEDVVIGTGETVQNFELIIEEN